MAWRWVRMEPACDNITWGWDITVWLGKSYYNIMFLVDLVWDCDSNSNDAWESCMRLELYETGTVCDWDDIIGSWASNSWEYKYCMQQTQYWLTPLEKTDHKPLTRKNLVNNKHEPHKLCSTKQAATHPHPTSPSLCLTKPVMLVSTCDQVVPTDTSTSNALAKQLNVI